MGTVEHPPPPGTSAARWAQTCPDPGRAGVLDADTLRMPPHVRCVGVGRESDLGEAVVDLEVDAVDAARVR